MIHWLRRPIAKYKHRKACWLHGECYRGTRYLVAAYMDVRGFSSDGKELRRAMHAAYRAHIKMERDKRDID